MAGNRLCSSRNPSAMTISENKAALRRALLEQRARVSATEKAAMGSEITRRVLASEVFRAAETVFTYCSTADEIDTRAILRACLEQGKTLCVPRCEAARGVMTARRIVSEDALTDGKYGILEPTPDAPVVPPEQIGLCIVPCLAADAAGYRLGYGGGYYDRFLARTRGVSIALCADGRLLPEIPRDAFDIPCDLIYTERRIIICETNQT